MLPIAEFTLPYKDVFTLELPFGPPPEVRGNLNNEQQRELARLFNAPKVMHKVRLTNNSKYPLTTAPALIIRTGRVLAQGMMTYTSTGASVDLPITTAVDFQVKKSDVETKRTPGAVEENGNRYTRVDLAGKITVTSHRAQPTELEITRYVLGAADSADADGKVEKINVFENGEYLTGGDYPYWWNWYGWPHWWNYFNGIGRVTWKLSFEPNQSQRAELPVALFLAVRALAKPTGETVAPIGWRAGSKSGNGTVCGPSAAGQAGRLSYGVVSRSSPRWGAQSSERRRQPVARGGQRTARPTHHRIRVVPASSVQVCLSEVSSSRLLWLRLDGLVS